MKSVLTAALFVLVVATAIDTDAAARPRGSDGGPQVASSESSNLLGEYVRDEAARRELSYVLAPVKSAADLAAYVATTPKNVSPLERLSPAAKNRFLKGLVFNERGLAGFDYSDLQAELSATEIYQVLRLFGAEHTASLIRDARTESHSDRIITRMMLPPEDHEGYKCSSRATCSSWPSSICMSSC